jgi:hypothetical protein
MPIDWDNLSPEEKERFCKITAKAKAIEEEATVLAQLQEKRKQYVQELISICRGCNDEKCIQNQECEVRKAYAMLFCKQEKTVVEV